MFQFKTLDNNISNNTYPIFILLTDNWDDFGINSLFSLYFFKSQSESIRIGKIKILQKDKRRTELPPIFSLLDKKYISLGQGLQFYKNLLSIFSYEESTIILDSLNDIAWKPNKAESFESKSEYRNSLLRENSARVSLRFGRSIILDEQYSESFSFKYTATIEGSDNPVDISVDFDESDPVPGRIVGIVGRNAVGKTQLMGSLAKDLVQVGRVSQKAVHDSNERFEGSRPLFNRVITISYSAFDKFIRPKDPHVSYVYCGIRNDKGGLSRKSLIENYKKNLLRINQLDRARVWISSMSKILDNTSKEFITKLNNEIESHSEIGSENESDTLSLLSSGQSILAHFVTALVARIQDNTLILFDEPETHLHPNAVAHLFNVLNDILELYDSFAIIATHSPVVIQEIPKKRVILLTREGNCTLNTPMDFETFGESISELTRHVFDTVSTPHYYKKVLKDLSQTKNLEEVNDLFNNGLSFNAKAYLLAQYSDKK